MIVKICGITNREDALAAVNGGAAALGFNFYPKSPRYIVPACAAEVIGAAPAHVWKVGVFVNESRERVAEIARVLALDVVQLHGDEAASDYPESVRVWKAVRVDAAFDPAAWRGNPAEALVLDGPAGAVYGGAGVAFDWRRARGLPKIVLAGGLDASNVREAIAQAHPWGVDACSRLESAPGKKDHHKLAAFLKAALETT
jgi:phosphoribosylanthranilate isomerase